MNFRISLTEAKKLSKTNYYTEEQNKIICQKIREIPIQDYAASRGFQITKKGSYYKIKGQKGVSDFSSVMIKPSTNRYRRFKNDRRWNSIIDFVMELDGCDEKNAIQTLLPLIDTYDLETAVLSKQKSDQKQGVEPISFDNLPERANTVSHAKAYLIKTRCINPDIVDDFIYSNSLYEDEKHNCVFVCYNRQGEPTFCNKRGTNTYAKEGFKWAHPGSDYAHGYYINNGSDTLIVTEAVIETMSVMSILQDSGKRINSYDYNALAGTGNWETVINILSEHPRYKNLVLACNNDNGGFEAMKHIRLAVSNEFPHIKIKHFLPKTENDWNDQLKIIRKNGISVADYLRLQPEELIKAFTVNPSNTLTENNNLIIKFAKIGGDLF